MRTNVQLETALANLAYSIAYADGKLEDPEWNAFDEMVVSELGESAVSVKNKFLLLGERASPNIDQTYREAMFVIKNNREYFDDNLKQRFIKVLEHIADSVEGLREEERNLIERFKHDVDLI